MSDKIVSKIIGKFINQAELTILDDTNFYLYTSAGLDVGDIISLVRYFDSHSLPIDNFEQTLIGVLEDHGVYRKLLHSQKIKAIEYSGNMQLSENPPIIMLHLDITPEPSILPQKDVSR